MVPDAPNRPTGTRLSASSAVRADGMTFEKSVLQSDFAHCGKCPPARCTTRRARGLHSTRTGCSCRRSRCGRPPERPWVHSFRPSFERLRLARGCREAAATGRRPPQWRDATTPPPGQRTRPDGALRSLRPCSRSGSRAARWQPRRGNGSRSSLPTVGASAQRGGGTKRLPRSSHSLTRCSSSSSRSSRSSSGGRGSTRPGHQPAMAPATGGITRRPMRRPRVAARPRSPPPRRSIAPPQRLRPRRRPPPPRGCSAIRRRCRRPPRRRSRWGRRWGAHAAAGRTRRRPP